MLIMELDERNIRRLIRIRTHYIKKNFRNILLSIMAYLYLYGGFYYIVSYYAKGLLEYWYSLEFLLITGVTLLLYIAYLLINHLIVRFVIRHKILLIFDTLLLMVLIECLFIN